MSAAPHDDRLNLWLANLVAWRESPALAMGGTSVREPTFAAADLGLGWALFNSTTLLRPMDESNAAEVLAAVRQAYSPDRRGDLLLWSPWPTPDLRRHGWQLYDQPWFMHREPSAVAHTASGELAIESVRTTSQLTEFLSVAAEAFPFEDLKVAPHSWDVRVLEDPGIQCWLGRLEGKVVSTSATVVAGGLNGVTLVATLPAYRRRGFGATLADHAARFDPALAAGLLAGEGSRPIYERLGFEKVHRFTVWTAPRPARS